MRVSSLVIPQNSFLGKPNTDLRKLWMKEKLPTVTHGFYGDVLTKQNVSREHLQPASQGGKRTFGNIVLASDIKNGARSNSDISKFADIETVKQYLAQFIDIKVKEFNGNEYIQAVIRKLKSLGFNLSKG